MSELSPELIERMVALVRGMAVPSDADTITGQYVEARAIAAQLPKPVDPDLIEARKIASAVLTDLGASAEQIAAGGIAAGERDDAIVMHVAMACLARGRELAREQSNV